MNKQITKEELPNYKGRIITMINSEGKTHTGQFLEVKEFSVGKSVSFKLDRLDKWNGIEMWFEYPKDDTKLYVHE